MPINTSQTVGNITQAAFAKSAVAFAQKSQLSMIDAQEAKELANETDEVKREKIAKKYLNLRKENPAYQKLVRKYDKIGATSQLEKAAIALKSDPSFEELKGALDKYGSKK